MNFRISLDWILLLEERTHVWIHWGLQCRWRWVLALCSMCGVSVVLTIKVAPPWNAYDVGKESPGLLNHHTPHRRKTPQTSIFASFSVILIVFGDRRKKILLLKNPPFHWVGVRSLLWVGFKKAELVFKADLNTVQYILLMEEIQSNFH